MSVTKNLDFQTDPAYLRKEAQGFAVFAACVATLTLASFFQWPFWEPHNGVDYMHWLGGFCALGLAMTALSYHKKSKTIVTLYKVNANGITDRHGKLWPWGQFTDYEIHRSNAYLLGEKKLGLEIRSELSPEQRKELHHALKLYLPEHVSRKL